MGHGGRSDAHERPDVVVQLKEFWTRFQIRLFSRFGSLDISDEFVDSVEQDPTLDQGDKTIFDGMTIPLARATFGSLVRERGEEERLRVYILFEQVVRP